MELFRLTCVTCQAHLSVRDRAAIGKILSCPRCGSMVQVTAPPGLTGSVFVEDAPSQLSALRQPSAPSSPTSVPLLSPVPSSQSLAPSSQPPAVAHSDLEDMPQDGAPVRVPSKPGWYFVPGDLKRQVIAWSLAGTVAAAALVAVLAWSLGKGPVNRAATGGQVALDQPANQHESVSQHELASPEGAMHSEVSDTVDLTESLAPVAEERTSRGIFQDPEKGPGNTSEKRNEPDVDLPDIDMPGPEVLIADKPGADTLPPLPPLPDGTELSAEKTELEPSEVSGARPATQVVRIDPTAVPLAEMPAAKEQLKVRIPAIEVDRMPLYLFLELISDLGGVPIRWGSEELRMAAISTETPMSIKRQQSSLAEILHEALQPLHLDYRSAGPLIIIHWPGAERHREINYPIADLVTPETDARQLADWIRQVVVPSSWRAADEMGDLQIIGDTLRITQSQRVQYQVLCFLERLRLVRKLKPRSRYPVERLAVEPAYQQLAENLQAQTTFTFSRYTPLREIFSYWQEQLGLALLVDWSAVLGEYPNHQPGPVGDHQEIVGVREESLLGPAMLGPTTPVACAVADLPWHQALDTVLEPLGLAWRAIDGRTLQITSVEVAQGIAQLEFYSLVPEGSPGRQQGELAKASLVAAMAELKNLVDESNSTLLPHSQTALILDPVSQHVLALQPAVVQWLLWQRIYGTRLGLRMSEP